MYIVYINKKGVSIKQVYGEYYAVFKGEKHICDKSDLNEAIKIADSI